jgi:WD40 repeat protein
VIAERWRASFDAQPVAVAPTAFGMAVGLDDGQVVHLDARTGRAHARLKVHDDGLLTLVSSPDGTLVATGGADGRIRLSTTEGVLASGLTRAWVDRLAWIDRRSVVASAGTGLFQLGLDGQLATHDLGRGVMALTTSGAVPGLVAVAVTGALLLAEARDLSRIEEHRLLATPRSLAAHPRGLGWAMGTQECSLVCLRMTDRRASRLEGYVRPARDLCFSPDGASLATSGMNLLVVWSLPRLDCNEAEASVVETDGEPVALVRFHPSGRGLAVVTKPGNLIVLDSRTRTRQRHALAAPPTALVFSPDGDWLACATADGALRAYDWPSRPDPPARNVRA